MKGLAQELVGLFVDDGRFALAIAVWVGVMAVVVRMTGDGAYLGLALFGGLAALLIWTCGEAVARNSRSRFPGRKK